MGLSVFKIRIFINIGGIILRTLLKITRNFISIISFAPFWPDVTEEDIGKNMAILKKYEWFQKYLADDKFKKLIVYDSDVRNVIGEFNNNKIKRDSFHNKCEKKIRKVLLSKTNSFA